LVEFVAATTRTRRDGPPLLEPTVARREVEEMVTVFEVLYPNEGVVRAAVRGAAAYQLSWFDAHLWGYADHFGIEEIISEDFQDGGVYGTVKIRNAFRSARPRRTRRR
jgi:predicted nucleic acid-binding protein